MQNKYIDIETISDLYKLMRYPTPGHPMVSLLDQCKFMEAQSNTNYVCRLGFYMIACKKIEGEFKYGRGIYDFDRGSLFFIAPGQVIPASTGIIVEEGWTLLFHPDLLYGTDLGKRMHLYSFFNYEANEALHISDDEQATLKDCTTKIAKEYGQNMDKHTQGLIVNNIELLLNYCNRFYDRQFYSRGKVSSDVVQQFEILLKDYFSQNVTTEAGLPGVGYFASRLNLSPNYLSDLLQKFTGKTTLEHIHLEIVNRAKSLLWGTETSISEIAYRLGFDHPSHFTKIFKTKTGKSPSDYRLLN